MKLTTLCYVVRGDEVLLAMKKRGFGEGMWNGSGGKVAPGETIKQAAIREVQEEIGLRVSTLEDRGVLEFVYEGRPDWSSSCSIFVCSDFVGEPTESEEMRPQWFALDAVPWKEMWESDRVWFPELLRGERVGYRFVYNADKKFLRHELLPL